MSKAGGWSRNVKGRPHQRIVCIPHQGTKAVQFNIPKGIKVLSHTSFMNRGMLISQFVVDVRDEVIDPGPQMPDDWDYRNLLRDDVTPVRRRVARRKPQREPGERDNAAASLRLSPRPVLRDGGIMGFIKWPPWKITSWRLLGAKCVDCPDDGEFKRDWRCHQFDHIHGDGYKLAQRQSGGSRTERELKKRFNDGELSAYYVIRCANHHAIKTRAKGEVNQFKRREECERDHAQLSLLDDDDQGGTS